MGSYGSAWQANGYSGSGNVEDLIDSLHGRPAVVAGNAATVFEEYDKYVQGDPYIFGVNDAGVYIPRVHAMVSLHTERLLLWRALRKSGQGESRWWDDIKTHSFQKTVGLDYFWHELTPTCSLSGYFAMQIAHIMGAGRITLIGCPGSPVPRFFETRPRRDGFGYGGAASKVDDGTKKQIMLEAKRVPGLKDKVRSASGWTREFFGAPEDI